MRFHRYMAVVAALSALLSSAPAHASHLSPQQGGGELWIDRYNPEGDAGAAGLFPLMAPDGTTVYAVGAITGDLGGHRIVAFEPATGEQRWAAERADGFGAHIGALSSDGSRIYLAGTIPTGTETREDWAIVALDAADGHELWRTTFGGIGRRDLPTGIAVAPEGDRLYVTGMSTMPESFKRGFATLAFDAASGTTLWTSRYFGPNRGKDEPAGAVLSPDGDRLFVTGWSPGRTTDEDFATLSYDASNGERRWVRRYDGPGGGTSHDLPDSVVIAPDGGTIFVTGQSTGAGGKPDWQTIAYRSSDGDKVWSARYSRGARAEDHPNAMTIAADGDRIYVTGDSSRGGNIDATTIAYAARNGSRAWVAHYDGPQRKQDFGWDIEASPDGRHVYVTVEATFGERNRPDFLTIDYSANGGAARWASRYEGPERSRDYFPTLAVSPDSRRVFVVGREWPDDSDLWFTTIAYEPVPFE